MTFQRYRLPVRPPVFGNDGRGQDVCIFNDKQALRYQNGGWWTQGSLALRVNKCGRGWGGAGLGQVGRAEIRTPLRCLGKKINIAEFGHSSFRCGRKRAKGKELELKFALAARKAVYTCC